MPISYDPKDASSAWPADEYDAVILAVEETTSKKTGADMYKVTLEAFNKEGKKQTIYDYIVVPAAVFKLKMIAQALDKVAEFNAGKFDLTKYQNRRLTLDLDMVEDPQYGDKNTVRKYLAPKAGSSAPVTKRGPGYGADPSMKDVLKEREAVNAGAGSPISGDEHFKEDDIPF